MKHYIAICNTPYQLMIAVKLKNSIYASDNITLLLSDHMRNHSILAENTKKANIFFDVFPITTKKLLHTGKKQKWSLVLSKKNCADYFQQFFPTDKKYDGLLFANTDYVNTLIYQSLTNKSKDFSISMFEDGLSTYSNQYPMRFKEYENFDFLRKKSVYIYKLIKRIYVLNPDMMEWRPSFPVSTIDTLNTNDIDCLNKCFCVDVDKIQKQYNRQVIFFEESYFAENIPVDDAKIVQHISNMVGKENILVKMHPRSPRNRFEPLGYETNNSIEIPWEIIALNIDISSKILVTIGSAAALVSLTSLYPKKTIMLFTCKEFKNNTILPYESLEHFCKYSKTPITTFHSIDEITL